MVKYFKGKKADEKNNMILGLLKEIYRCMLKCYCTENT